MSGDDPSRRFTDREVALILARAAELEDQEPPERAGGLTLEELRDIGREVGISSAAIDRAVAALGSGASGRGPLRRIPTSHRAVRAVAGEVGENDLRRLVRLIDERSDQAGTVSEALGSVRWTGSDRFRNTQVTITPAGGETRVAVVEKLTRRIGPVLHVVPAIWGVALAGPVVEALGVHGFSLAGVLAAGGAVGAAVGRTVWARLSARSRERVERLAAELAREAEEAAER